VESQKQTMPDTKLSRDSRDPLWYKNAVIYELHVRAFQDSNGDGIGDFRGLTQRLDYLHDLGITAIWLLPFYPSPLKDDGYDIADYYSINPIFGTLLDFREFLDAAHARNLRVITELVVNHTSDQHPWFQRARRAQPGDPWREFYVWSDTQERYKSARIIFRDFELSNWTWDPVAKAHFWHRFYSHQPDLNFDNPLVHQELIKVLDYWLDMGVDGLRLDAVPYLYEREGTSCENLPETHGFLRSLRSHIDQKYGDRMLLAEANQWPEDSVAYFGAGDGDECHMAFHFPLMPRLFMSVRMEDRVPVVDIMEQTPPIPPTSHWALFLRNHDELTLEMVTDEERDYMYRMYAHDVKARINLGIRRRLAPLLGNDRKKIELLNLLLLSFPGTPVIYYGDEIGMGDNIFLGDRNGVRTPMQWSSDKNAGFSRANPQALFLPVSLEPEYHYEAVNVEAQQRNPNSLLWWMKRVLTLRKRFRAFGSGKLEFLQPENRKILAFIRSFESETLLVVANLSRFAQPARLDLTTYASCVPVELFGRTEFPQITSEPFYLTLGPHSAMWFSLEAVSGRDEARASTVGQQPLLAAKSWEEALTQPGVGLLETRLGGYLRNRRWFQFHKGEVASVRIREIIPLDTSGHAGFLLILGVEHRNGENEEYLMPLGYAAGEEAERLEINRPNLIISALRILSSGRQGLLYDASGNNETASSLLGLIAQQRMLNGSEGELRGWRMPDQSVLPADGAAAALSRAEQSNTSIIFGDQLILKLFRRLEPGPHPEVELGRFLVEHGAASIVPFVGSIEYYRPGSEPIVVGALHQFYPQAKNGWDFTLDTLGRYFERVRSLPREEIAGLLQVPGTFMEVAAMTLPSNVVSLAGTYIEAAKLLAQRTAEMHCILGQDQDNPSFAPEPFTPFYQRGLYQSMRNLVVRAFGELKLRLPGLPARTQKMAAQILGMERDILQRLKQVYAMPIQAVRIRCHGDFHLGQVMHTGKDFLIMDFEGESIRPLGERRIKRSPLRDVAGMIRSFGFAAHAAVFDQLEQGAIEEEHVPLMEPWILFWHRWVSAAFLRAYLKRMAGSGLLPASHNETAVLLDAHLLSKAVYELQHELAYREKWVQIPLEAILHLMGVGQSTAAQNQPEMAPL
jgi:maltose alpha-D-glucosyltransferase/alpha-amylase